MSENLALIAIALETIEHIRTKYGQNAVYQKSIISCLKTILGEKSHSIEATEFSWLEKPEKTQYEPKLTDMISEYVSIELYNSMRKKSNDEVPAWLRCMAK